MRTEGFKGAMFSALVIASMVTAALSISITSVSATHTTTVSIDDDTVKANKTMVRTITVQNAGPDAIDNVWIVVPSGFTGFAPVMNDPINWNQSVAASSTAPPGTYVEWTGIGENRIASGASLAFPFAVTTPPAGGDYTISVKTTDTTGLSALKEITLTIDNVSPTATVTASPRWVKDNVEVTITLTASESLAKLENVMVAENNAQENTQIVMTPNADNTVWIGAYTTGDNSKRDGTAKIYVIGSQFEDLVGNKGSGVFENTFTIDRLKPLKPNIDALTGFPTSPTNDGSWTIEGTAQDNFLGGTVNLENGTVKVRVGTTVHDVTTTATGYFSKSITLTEGTQEVGIQYVDLAGNVGPENAENVTYDETAPSISIISPADGAIITDNTPLIRLTVADAVMGVENDNFSSVDNSGYLVYLRKDADNDVIAQLTPKAYPTSDPFKSFTFKNQWPTELPDGWYNVFVIAGDNLQSDTAYFRFMVQALTRDPICIDGNDNFIPANGVVGGSGTEDDPYIIGNWDISAENANGIEIRNTTARFVIRNCYVHGGRINWNNGIVLDNVMNGKIENCILNNGSESIKLRNSPMNTIVDCVIENQDGGIELYESSNNAVIRNCTVRNSEQFGIGLYFSSSNTRIENCVVENSGYGITVHYSENITLRNNIMENNWSGIYLHSSNNNFMTDSIIQNNSYGIFLDESNNNRIYHNNFVNNENQAYDNGTNYWDNGYPSGGNYWSDYTGADNYRGENQDIPGSDGIGDTPYYIPGDNNQDRYPLMSPWLPVILATIDINPNTLNLKSRGRWITCFIEIPEGYDVADIDIGSIRLNGVVPAEPKPTEIGGRKLMVKFSRPAVQAIVSIGEVELTVTGSVNGMPFEGNDTIRVIKPGKVDLEIRLTEIPFEWAGADAAGKLELETEFMEIPFYWSAAPS